MSKNWDKRIAAIDAGKTTGLAIARVIATEKAVHLYKLELRSVTADNQLSIVEQCLKLKVEFVVLEKRPMYASQDGTLHYEFIKNSLSQYYTEQTSFLYTPNKMCLISPGLWKPVMRHQPIISTGSWQAETQHERDALAMLHYVMKLNHMTKEVQYE